MNQIFLGEPSQEIKNWFIETFPSWPIYTTLKFVDGTTQTKALSGIITWKNIGVKNDVGDQNTTLVYCQIGKNVTEISGNALSNCIKLEKVELPDSITVIADNTFDYCYSLASINIPSSVTKIGDNSTIFYHCSSLTSIDIPSSVTSIGGWVFYNCSSLTSIVFEGRTMDQITAMTGYPFGIENTSIIRCYVLSDNI